MTSYNLMRTLWCSHVIMIIIRGILKLLWKICVINFWSKCSIFHGWVCSLQNWFHLWTTTKLVRNTWTHHLFFLLFILFHIFDSDIRTWNSLRWTDLWYCISVSSLLFCNWKSPYHFWWCNTSNWWWRPIFIQMSISVLSLQSVESLSAWKSFMQNSHQRVEHFRTNIIVYIFVMFETHLLRSAPCHIIIEDLLCK